MIPNETPINLVLEIGEQSSSDNTISVDTGKTDVPNQAGYALEKATDIMKEEIISGRKKSAVSIIEEELHRSNRSFPSAAAATSNYEEMMSEVLKHDHLFLTPALIIKIRKTLPKNCQLADFQLADGKKEK